MTIRFETYDKANQKVVKMTFPAKDVIGASQLSSTSTRIEVSILPKKLRSDYGRKKRNPNQRVLHVRAFESLTTLLFITDIYENTQN